MASSAPIIADLLARAVGASRSRSLPPPVRDTCTRLLFDIAGLCVAARHESYVRAALESCEAAGACTAIGHARALDSAGAAFVNGTAAHGEDFDDTFEGGPVHANCRAAVPHRDRAGPLSRWRGGPRMEGEPVDSG